jgi:hypothetical protein
MNNSGSLIVRDLERDGKGPSAQSRLWAEASRERFLSSGLENCLLGTYDLPFRVSKNLRRGVLVRNMHAP